jgi:hypothetical protein
MERGGVVPFGAAVQALQHQRSNNHPQIYLGLASNEEKERKVLNLAIGKLVSS